MKTKATDSYAVTSGQTTSSMIDKLSSKHHLSMLCEVHPINDQNADVDRHQDILSLALSIAILTSIKLLKPDGWWQLGVGGPG
ncbi:hypothetical protein GBA52_018828 [Prunus armeniaca]|nr:hypothetical protein GBA52_018828 [Prunus armeniaca]